jgi:hypothetical protein
MLREFGLSVQHIVRQLAEFASFGACTGNNTLAEPAPSSGWREIVNGDTAERDYACRLEALSEADRLLGYSQ